MRMGNNVARNSKHDFVIERAEGCLARLETDYLDLLLIHWPDLRHALRRNHSSIGKIEGGWEDPALRRIKLHAGDDGRV